MSATITLLRIQLHFMKWPLVALTTSTFILCLNHDESDMIGVIQRLALMSLPLLVWLVGPVLFGSEYVEGAKDYIDTKPVSINQVFWTKMLFLLPFVVYCVFIYSGDMLVSVYLLNMALAGVAMTVFFRDMVRGILTGPIAAVVFGALLLIPWYVFCGNHTRKPWEYTGGEYPWMLQLFIKLNEYFLPGFLILSTLIFLWATRWMYQFRRTGSWCPPLDGSIVLLPPCLLYAGFAASCWYHEGSASYIHFPWWPEAQKEAPFRSCLARVLVDNQQRYISLGEKEGEFLVHEVSDRIGEGKPRELFRFTSSLARESVLRRKEKGEYHGWEPWIDDKNIVLINNESKDVVCIHYNTSGIIDSNTISLDIKPVYISVVTSGKMMIHGESSEATITNQGHANFRDVELDLLTGEVKQLSGGLNTMLGLFVKDGGVFEIIQTKSRCYKMWMGENVGGGRTIEWRDNSMPADIPFNSPMLRVDSPVVNDTLIAATYMERVESASDLTPVIRNNDRIFLYDTSVNSGSEMSSIKLPYRLCGVYHHLFCAYRQFGLMHIYYDIGLPSPLNDICPVTFSDGYLFCWALQVGRVAVWNVHDPTNAKFIGISNCPAHFIEGDHSDLLWHSINRVITPQVRSDGALGFIMDNYGPVWLEFPALMHKV